VLGSLTLIALAGAIIYITTFRGSQRGDDDILTRVFGSGQVTSASGVQMGPSYVDVSMLDFDRRRDSLRFSYVSRDGKIGLIPERNIDLAGKISFVGDKVITVSST
jgi:hypothetical protein